jgi:tRNA 2-thiouridine synthesizing protein E
VPGETTTLEVGGRSVATSINGFLLDHSDWTPEVTEAMAAADGVELTADHWLLIDFLHRFYGEFGVAPEMAVLSHSLCRDQGDCRWTRKYIRELFPEGIDCGCRYAGLPAPLGRYCG